MLLAQSCSSFYSAFVRSGELHVVLRFACFTIARDSGQYSLCLCKLEQWKLFQGVKLLSVDASGIRRYSSHHLPLHEKASPPLPPTISRSDLLECTWYDQPPPTNFLPYIHKKVKRLYRLLNEVFNYLIVEFYV
jgi:hypothetical protein